MNMSQATYHQFVIVNGELLRWTASLTTSSHLFLPKVTCHAESKAKQLTSKRLHKNCEMQLVCGETVILT